MVNTRKIAALNELYKQLIQKEENEKIRISARRISQKKGKSIATQKTPKKVKKPVRMNRKVTKKRSSIR